MNSKKKQKKNNCTSIKLMTLIIISSNVGNNLNINVYTQRRHVHARVPDNTPSPGRRIEKKGAFSYINHLEVLLLTDHKINTTLSTVNYVYL